ncbi:hypothetical protein [Amaricoccus sp. W119]|uniref:hypothetical protein n=1 Tax=Amaricoccus sp. W119 TaxID=3391833 RepID=UPI0039A61E47
MAPKTDRFPYAKSYTDRHDKRRWRYRHRGRTAELGTEWGSDEFARRYAEAVNGRKEGAGADRTAPGTFDDLVVRFYRLHFPTIEESTAADYRSVLEPLRRKHGHKRVSHMARRHVLEIKAELADTPQQANETLKRLSQLMDLAVDLEWWKDNPVRGVKRSPVSPAGFHAWDEGEIGRFYEVHKMGSPAHLTMTLMLYTGASKCDAVMGRGNIREGRLIYRRRKTKKNPDGFEVDLMIPPTSRKRCRTFARTPSPSWKFSAVPLGRLRASARP